MLSQINIAQQWHCAASAPNFIYTPPSLVGLYNSIVRKTKSFTTNHYQLGMTACLGGYFLRKDRNKVQGYSLALSTQLTCEGLGLNPQPLGEGVINETKGMYFFPRLRRRSKKSALILQACLPQLSPFVSTFHQVSLTSCGNLPVFPSSVTSSLTNPIYQRLVSALSLCP